MISPLETFHIPGQLTILSGPGNLPKIRVETQWSSAEIHLHGAQVTHFQKKGDAPLLFLSAASDYVLGKPIRGGVPIIFPWFGSREGLPAHGFARTVPWNLVETAVLGSGEIRLRLALPTIAFFEAEFIVTVGESLSMELLVRNSGKQETALETCLHTYFQISDIAAISIHGLAGAACVDKLADRAFVESDAPLTIGSEMERVYRDTTATVEIVDPGLSRVIRIEKSGSMSTVVWNPWIEKSKRMPDFGDDEYPQMLCVESGNIGDDSLNLLPGALAAMKVVLSSHCIPAAR
jgi:D-hexose-6-phosphate mutarotase